jgi:hypothetical protein
MRIRATAATATVLLSAASSGYAQDAPPGHYHFYGAGTLTCGKWLDERKGSDW